MSFLSTAYLRHKLQFLLNAIVQSEECTVVLHKLRDHLPAHLQYHTLSHTMDVCKRAAELALQENVSPTDTELLLIAAAYHDTGYLIQAENHENISCRIARDILPQFGYGDKELEKICCIIMATQLPHHPQNLLEQIICDADLDYLGRNDFFTLSNLLYQEMVYQGVVKNEDEWNNLQIIFLENHHYFTATATKLRQAQKEAHLSILKHKIVKL